MITDLTSITAILTLGIPVLILIMLLPTVLELKKRKDESPRIIMDNISEGQIQIVNIENEQKFDKTIIAPLTKIIEVLPNLEV
jgi:hypothetical protein